MLSYFRIALTIIVCSVAIVIGSFLCATVHRLPAGPAEWTGVLAGLSALGGMFGVTFWAIWNTP